MEKKRTGLVEGTFYMETGLGKDEKCHLDLLDQVRMTDLTVRPKAVNRKLMREGPMAQGIEEMTGLPLSG